MVIGIDASRAFGNAKTGTENYSYSLIKHLLRVPESQQYKFVLFTRPNAVIPDWTRQNNVEIRPIKLRYLWTQLGLAWQTWGKPSLDLLWIPAHTLPLLRKPGLSTVVTIHGLEYQWLPEYQNWLQRWYLPLSTFYAAKQASRLIAVSKFTQKQLEKELQTIPKKIKVIWEGVEQKPIMPNSQIKAKVWQRFGLHNKKYILFVGTIQPRKNLAALIQAYKQISAQLPDHKLVIAGSVGWMATEVLQESSRLGITDSVVLTGRVDELTLSSLYLGASLYVQPSWTEGFGLPVLEAMSAGVPVVASDGGALPEVVGEAGLIVKLDKEFVPKLAVALKRVLTDPQLQQRLVTRGFERVKEFTWYRAARETLLYLTG